MRPPPRPPEDKAGPPGCLVFLHGGAWISGTPSLFSEDAVALSQDLGVAVACCEYRSLCTPKKAKDIPFDAVADARRCVRFLHEGAEDIGLDRERLVLAGVSAGGQMAAMAALEDHEALGLRGLVLFNPVLDLHFPAGPDAMAPLVRLGSWLLRARYGLEALAAESPIHQVRQVPYPTLIMHGAKDKLVPLAQSEAFREEMLRLGNTCSLVPFPHLDHYFFLGRSPADFSRCMGLLGAFLYSIGVLDTFGLAVP